MQNKNDYYRALLSMSNYSTPSCKAHNDVLIPRSLLKRQHRKQTPKSKLTELDQKIPQECLSVKPMHVRTLLQQYADRLREARPSAYASEGKMKASAPLPPRPPTIFQPGFEESIFN